jgi:hypothetical protein
MIRIQKIAEEPTMIKTRIAPGNRHRRTGGLGPRALRRGPVFRLGVSQRCRGERPPDRAIFSLDPSVGAWGTKDRISVSLGKMWPDRAVLAFMGPVPAFSARNNRGS